MGLHHYLRDSKRRSRSKKTLIWLLPPTFQYWEKCGRLKLMRIVVTSRPSNPASRVRIARKFLCRMFERIEYEKTSGRHVSPSCLCAWTGAR